MALWTREVSLVEVHQRRRFLLATIAAYGIFSHDGVSSSRLTRSRIQEIIPEYEETILEEDLQYLKDGGLLRGYDTSHTGYANIDVPGPYVWSVTQEGLVHLWTEPIPE